MPDTMTPSKPRLNIGESRSGRTPGPVDVIIGQRIRAFRQERGLSQEELAGRIGISAQQVHKYETGHNRISAGMLFLISRPLGVSPAAFYKGLEDKDEETGAGEDRAARRLRRVLHRAGMQNIRPSRLRRRG